MIMQQPGSYHYPMMPTGFPIPMPFAVPPHMVTQGLPIPMASLTGGGYMPTVVSDSPPPALPMGPTSSGERQPRRRFYTTGAVAAVPPAVFENHQQSREG